MRLYIDKIYIRIFIVTMLMFATAAPAWADGSIVITSDTLAAYRKASKAVFEGSVVAKTADMVLTAEHMTAYYDEDGAITLIEATGAVKLVKGLQVVTSTSAVYDVEGGNMIFTGEPRAVDEGNVVMGKKIIYSLDDGRIEVEGSTMIIEDMGGQAGGVDNE